MNYPVLDELRHKLLLLTFIYSYRCGRFLLSSGRYSSYYIDGKQVTMAPEGLYATAQYILASMQQRRIRADAIGGLTLGADPIAAGVAALSNIWAQKEGAPASLIPCHHLSCARKPKVTAPGRVLKAPFTAACGQ